MAILEAGYGDVSIDNASNTLTDIAGQVKTVKISYNAQTSTYYTLNTDFGSANVGKAAYTVDMEFYSTDGATDAKALLEAWMGGATAVRRAARSIEISIPEDATGNIQYTGEAKLASLTNVTGIDAASTEPVLQMARLLVDGVLTKATIAP